MYEDLAAVLEGLTPEEQAQLLGMGTLDERGDMLNQQLMQAQALRQQGGGQHSTPWGALLGGLGGIVNNISGGLQERDLRGRQEGLLGQKDKGRNLYADALRRLAAQRKAQTAPAELPFGDVQPVAPMGPAPAQAGPMTEHEMLMRRLGMG